MRFIRFALVLAVLTAVVGGTATAAQAATDPATLHIGYIRYDSAGSDTGSNSSLNDEWIRIHNNTGSTVTLTGYKIKDKAGHTWTFPTYKLEPYRNVYLHTGKGTRTPHHFYWGRSWYVWNNTSDTGYLIRPSGTTKDSCYYPSSDDAPGIGCHNR